MEQSVSTVPVIRSTAKIAEALAKAQSKIEPPEKKRTVDYTDKQGRRIKYKYADLADVIAAVRAPLSDNALSVSHELCYERDRYGMRTVLMHSSGETISSWYPLPDPQKQEIRAQEFGAALTYARRYSLSSIVGIASEEDDDGASAAPTPKPDKIPPAKSDTASKKGQAPSNQGGKIEVPPKQSPAKPNNLAPSTAEQQNRIIELAIDRNIPESELNLVLINGYGHKGIAPIWIANEMITELSKPYTTSETFAKFGELVKTRREAAHLKKQADAARVKEGGHDV